jgi:hypothetical protein
VRENEIIFNFEFLVLSFKLRSFSITIHSTCPPEAGKRWANLHMKLVLVKTGKNCKGLPP